MQIQRIEDHQGLQVSLMAEHKPVCSFAIDYRESFGRALIRTSKQEFVLRKTGLSPNQLEVRDSSGKVVARLTPAEHGSSALGTLEISGIRLTLEFQNIPQARLRILKTEHDVFYTFCAQACSGLSPDQVLVGRKAAILPHHELVAAIGLYLFFPFLAAEQFQTSEALAV